MRETNGAAGSDVVVAVLTFRRDELLAGLLPALVDQAGSIDPPAAIVVVDNDPGGSARDVVRRWADRGVRYVHEPRPGISAARNRALDECGDADALVFIDDDELPAPQWLDRLVSAWREWSCAAVAGPVPPRFDAPVDPWVLGSGVFDRPARATGAALRGAGAGNLLLDLSQVRSLALRFDERLGLTGGEDTLFTRQLVRRGGRIRWCAEAVAVEGIPAERLTRQWARRRSFRSASSWSHAELLLAASGLTRWKLRATVAAKAAAKLLGAALQLLSALGRSDLGARGRAVCTAASYLGLVAGGFGHVPAEYGRAVPTIPPAGATPRPQEADRATVS